MTTIAEMIQHGDVVGAREALVQSVKKAPSNVEARYMLAETLIAQGDWARADTHLDLLSTQDPTWGVHVALLRQLLRAAAHRDEVFMQGRAPDLVTPPSHAIETGLRILMASRSGDDAKVLREVADDTAPTLTGRVDDKPFETLRDLDDRTADILELLTSTGKYVWAPWSAVASLELRPIARIRDLVWRAAELELRDGPTGVVYLPMTYHADASTMTGGQLLARQTEWVEIGGLTCGVGQRCLLIGDDLVPFSEIERLTVTPIVDEG